MPRISDNYTDCAVYIYNSLDDAKRGERQGGSAFIVSVPSAHEGRAWEYIVTNGHVIGMAQTPVIRVNSRNGSVECFETHESEWIRHPDGDDIAILPFNFGVSELRTSSVPLSMFVTSEIVEYEDIGIGDDTFMVGRFISHDGKQQNLPAVRFGNISMMPKEPIVCPPIGIKQESFLVECRSLPGYSGSPVFLYSAAPMNDMSVQRFGISMRKSRTQSENQPETLQIQKGKRIPPLPLDMGLFEQAMTQMSAKGPYLLGIDWCHLNDHQKTNAGMAGVIPAWKIAEVLNLEEVAKARDDGDRHLQEILNGSPLDASRPV